MNVATTLTATAAIGSAVATVWLATTTRQLAKGTEALVKTTKAQGEQNAEANHLRDKLLRDTFLVENRRKLYRDLMYYLTVWRHHYEDLIEYTKDTMDKRGYLSVMSLGEIQRMSGAWPLKETFDSVRMTVELDLEDDHEIAELLRQWEEMRISCAGYLGTLIESIRKGISTIDTTMTSVVEGNPFNEVAASSSDSIGLIPSDRNVNYVISTVETFIPRLRIFEGNIEDIMKRKLDVSIID